MHRGILTAVAAAVAIVATPVAMPAAAQSMLDKAVNAVHVTSWNVYGPNQTSTIVDSTVQGGHAFRVDVTAPGANPWDVGVGSVSTKPIKSGDVLLLAVWLRAERLPAGAQTGKVNIRMQGNAAPYPDMGGAAVQPTGEWKLYFADGIATRDYAPGEMGATVQLAGAAQTVDLGPVFILDMGPDYDRTTLPRN
ncbi:hypothetical protein [Brevundimonas sp. Root1279]|uniref:hypothetical protein n=1 Tax=Brevundimonas sp. Root1279 TaxID=1736443 RepID=UPI0006F6B158|nr:hypothetical protein [Brevundimonas sp. Root1279]KQW83915.1 hypothetical protein ASC65_04605 [Brevundimonas sp. Root1279]